MRLAIVTYRCDYRQTALWGNIFFLPEFLQADACAQNVRHKSMFSDFIPKTVITQLLNCLPGQTQRRNRSWY